MQDFRMLNLVVRIVTGRLPNIKRLFLTSVEFSSALTSSTVIPSASWRVVFHYVRPERVYKWPNSTKDIWLLLLLSSIYLPHFAT